MPGWELINDDEKNALVDIFNRSNGVMFGHGFDQRRNNVFRVREFEAAFAEKMQVKHAIATTSGTMAQYVAMKALGITSVDEVITQAFTFVATVESILELGSNPIIIDVDNTFNIDLEILPNFLNSKTKLIVPVQMLGNQIDVNKLKKIVKDKSIKILEDSCEALGAKLYGKYVGTHFDVGIYSLDFAKTITTGEGGMIVTDDDDLAAYCKEFVDHGHENNPAFPRGRDSRRIRGLNLRMSEIQAAVGLEQLKKLDYIVTRNQENKNLLKSNIDLHDCLQYREILDAKEELADTLIFYFDNKDQARHFVEKYNAAGYFTKNLPDAIDWHFSGTWNHMFKGYELYENSWETEWAHTRNLLARAISIPILVNWDDSEIKIHANTINKILSEI